MNAIVLRSALLLLAILVAACLSVAKRAGLLG